MSTFADEEILALLRERFVAVAQDCDFTDRRTKGDALQRFFDAVVSQRDLAKFEGAAPSPTQGYYVFDHSGRLFDAMCFNYVDSVPDARPADDPLSVRRRNLRRLVEMIRRAAAHYADAASLPAAPYVPAGARTPTYPAVPDDVVVLRSWTRILPLPQGENELNSLVGRDTLWVKGDELRALCRGEVPELFLRRLALGNLRDNVRGAARSFRPDHIRRLDLTATIRARAPRLIVELRGGYLISAPAADRVRPLPEMGVEGSLEGVLVVDPATMKPVSWWIYADGEAWGEYPNTPGAPPERYPLKIALQLAAADDAWARVIPPLGATGDAAAYLERGLATRCAGIDDD